MWKMLIADDEMIIRRGLTHALDWATLGIEVVGEAEDGKIAVDRCNELKPDILLVDICMPFINGLELIEIINKMLPNTVIVIITGHDEFTYAKSAVRLNVFDYILKPVDEEELYQAIVKVVKVLENMKQAQLLNALRNQAFEKNITTIRKAFLLDLLRGLVLEEEVEEKLDYYSLNFRHKVGMLLIRPINNVNLYDKTHDFSDELLYFSIMNIVEETLEILDPHSEHLVVQKNQEHIIGIVSFTHKLNWYELSVTIEKNVEKYLNKKVIVLQELVEEGMKHIRQAYLTVQMRLDIEQMQTPIVVVAKKYIDTYYYKNDITLDEVADYVQVNPTYLSRLLKGELGNSFVDYLTKVRIKKSIEYMNDHSLKMYEIAESVGYNTQHYFSTAFKKVMGVSPNNYKTGGEKH